MSEQGGTRRQFILIAAVDPVDGKTSEVQISFERMQTVARRSLGHAKECGYLLPYVLQNPTAIFEGLTIEADEDRRGVGWRCYCGVPAHSYRADGTEAPPYPGQVFLVFVNEERIAYNWRWEQADRDEPTLPHNHDRRFKRRLL
jgi:hypothetical protein